MLCRMKSDTASVRHWAEIRHLGYLVGLGVIPVDEVITATLHTMKLRPEAQQEMERAVAVLADFAGHDLEALILDSGSLKQAPFFANTVSKLSPIIGNFMELRIAELLNENVATGFRWERQDPGLPEPQLTHP